MGWLHDVDAWRDHEGYVLGIVRTDDGGDWRELGADDRQRMNQLTWVQVGCDCGWRTQRMLAPVGIGWAPCSVTPPAGRDGELFEQAARSFWEEHMEDLCHDAPGALWRAFRRRESEALIARLQPAEHPPSAVPARGLGVPVPFRKSGAGTSSDVGQAVVAEAEAALTRPAIQKGRQSAGVDVG